MMEKEGGRWMRIGCWNDDGGTRGNVKEWGRERMGWKLKELKEGMG